MLNKNHHHRLCIASLALALTVGAAAAAEAMKFLDFEGTAIPKNHAGEFYPDQYTGEGGEAKINLNLPTVQDLFFDKRVDFEVTKGTLYAEFNAHNADGTRGFAREYVPTPSAWKFNTYNRLSFWMKNPVNGAVMAKDGTGSMEFGTYTKQVQNADDHSDEAGGGHWYHIFNLPNTNTWTRIIINTHPHHFRGNNGGTEEGNQPHPTDEPNYNYFDALTRFYINETHTGATAASIKYEFDNFEFFQEPYPENDEQIYSIAATYVAAEDKIVMTWSRDKDENTVKQEIRYSTKNIHEIGWAAATPAPNGIITPPGWQGYNGMVYTVTGLKPTGTIYIAIKPQNSELFSQVALNVSGTAAIRFDAPATRHITLNQWSAAEPGAGLTVLDASGRKVFLGRLSEYLSHDAMSGTAKAAGANLVYRIENTQGRDLWTGMIPSLH
ncbi:MAG: hypothetical protein JWO30_1018 [Fibrobacteres bacterium]|nr:hypothetical protein [Fibrobacterota bacterium]